MKLQDIRPGDTLLWRHRDAEALKPIAKSARQLERSVVVESICDEYLKTNYGRYSLIDGCNIDTPCGCNRFCSCYGVVEKPSNCAGC